MEATTFDKAVDAVMQLSAEQQKMLIDIIRNRQIENRRAEIAGDARESIAAFRVGKFSSLSADNVISELRQTLETSDEI